MSIELKIKQADSNNDGEVVELVDLELPYVIEGVRDDQATINYDPANGDVTICIPSDDLDGIYITFYNSIEGNMSNKEIAEYVEEIADEIESLEKEGETFDRDEFEEIVQSLFY